MLLVVEIKTRLDDVGSIERQLGWYERSAFDVARSLGWRPRRVVGWLLALASDEVEAALRVNRDVFAQSFPKGPAIWRTSWSVRHGPADGASG